jgi:hypothetical protein
MEWEVQIWERGRWCLHALHKSFSFATMQVEDLNKSGMTARLVPNDSAPGLESAKSEE